VGHSFGASVALALLAARPQLSALAVLEELPGPSSVDWEAEADAIRGGAGQARLQPAAVLARTRAAQPHWAEQDCHFAVRDLARCRDDDVAAGLRNGPSWTWPARIDPQLRVLLLLAPDAVGVNRLEDATALRGADRRRATVDLHARVVELKAGHCVHRDDVDGWLHAVTAFTRAS